MGVLRHLTALLGSQAATSPLASLISRDLTANISSGAASIQGQELSSEVPKHSQTSLEVPDFITAVGLVDGGFEVGLGHRRWWAVFGHVAAVTSGLGVAAGLGLSENATGLIPAAQQSRVEMHLGNLAEDPDRFMREFEGSPGKDNLTWMATNYALHVASGKDVKGESFKQPVMDIISSQWGRKGLLKIATGEWAIRQAQNWYISVVGAAMWDVSLRVADLLAGKNTSGQVIYHYLVAEHVIQEIENVVVAHMEYGYSSRNKYSVGHLVMELAGELAIGDTHTGVWALIDDGFSMNHSKVLIDIDALWYTQPVRERIDEAISLYCQGKAGPMLQYGVGIGFGDSNCLLDHHNSTSDTASTTISPSTTTTTTTTITTIISAQVDAPPALQKRLPLGWSKLPSSCDCGQSLEELCPGSVQDEALPHPDGKHLGGEKEDVSPEEYPCCDICKQALRVDGGGPVTPYAEPTSTITEEQTRDGPEWTTTYTYPGPGDHDRPHHPRPGYNHTRSVFNHTMPGHRTRPGGIHHPPKHRPTGPGHGIGDGDDYGDGDDHHHSHHMPPWDHPHHTPPWDHPHPDWTLAQTAEPTV